MKIVLTLSLLIAVVAPVWAQQTLSLKRAQEIALAQNAIVKVGHAQVAKARALKLQSWSGHLPSVRVTQGWMRSNDAVSVFGFRLKQEQFTQADFAIDALNFPAARTNYQTKVGIAVPLFTSGLSYYSRRQASTGVRIAELGFERQKETVRLQTARAYWQVVLVNEGFKAVQQGLETAREHARVVEAHYRQETIDQVALLSAQVHVAELEGEKIKAQNQVRDAMDELALVLNMPFEQDLVLTDTLAFREVPQDFDALIQQALSLRLDLRAAQLQAQTAVQGVSKKRAALLPQVQGVATFVLDSNERFARQGESWTIGAMATWDLFDGGKSLGALRAARAAREGAQVQADDLKVRVVKDVRLALRHVVSAHAQVEIAEKGLTLSVEKLRVAKLRYREGLIASADVLIAEAALRKARVRRAQALYDLNVGSALLHFAVGDDNL